MSVDELTGVPGTFTDGFRRPRWRKTSDAVRVSPGVLGRCYEADVPDGKLTCVVGREPAGEGGRLLWHVSVAFRDREGKFTRCPTWDELKAAAYAFDLPDVCWVLIFPRRSTPAAHYVNIHETCLHLWESEID